MSFLLKLWDFSYIYVALMAIAVGGVFAGIKLRKMKDAK
ncbi:hypothetical protein lbkm_0948 [Lachnospiraceae bacterium KM106-2]|nr:hypothetical protein lbkm_0948 [Lachnospiraceae bacterium KM106-2]